jgi:aldehyde dehydrogenase (NAD+)
MSKYFGITLIYIYHQSSRIAALLKQTKGMVLHNGGELDRDDLYIPPMVIEIDNEEDPLMGSEIFGPILPIYIVEDFDEAIEFLRHRESPINVSIFTKSAEKTDRVVKEVRAGNVLQNDVIMNFTGKFLNLVRTVTYPILVDTLPFAGFGQSGLGGAYRGKFGFETFSHRKSVMKRGFLADCIMT